MTNKIRIRALSYNMHKGFTSPSGRFVLKDIREAIRKVHADIVFLQEIVGKNEKHAKKLTPHWPESQFEYMADQLWPHTAYGKNAIYTEGHHGNAILSKYPFVKWENMDVSTNKLESRGLLHGVIHIPHYSKPLHVICLHLGLFEMDRQVQLNALCKRIRALVPQDEPLIVGGDFNDWREQASYILAEQVGLQEVFLETKGEHARTFPAWLPVLRLDRIYYRGLTLRAARNHNGPPWSRLSDHAPISAWFHLTKTT